MEPLRRAHLVVRGRVQGVFFRESMRRTAEGLGLSGFVRNLPDGTVEAELQGPGSGVAHAIEWAHRGPPAAEVTGVDVAWLEVQDGEVGFRVLR